MADTGWQFPGTTSGSRGTGTFAWVSHADITADDGNSASCSVITGPNSSQGLAGASFGFSGDIPAGATIDGIEVQVGDWAMSPADNITWTDVQLILADDSDGTEDKSSDFSAWNTTVQTEAAGGASDLWSETVDRADVIDVDWGFFIRVDGATNDVAVVDYFRMKIYYSEMTITDVDGDETWTDGDTGLVITGQGFT